MVVVIITYGNGFNWHDLLEHIFKILNVRKERKNDLNVQDRKLSVSCKVKKAVQQ